LQASSFVTIVLLLVQAYFFSKAVIFCFQLICWLIFSFQYFMLAYSFFSAVTISFLLIRVIKFDFLEEENEFLDVER